MKDPKTREASAAEELRHATDEETEPTGTGPKE